VLDRFRETLQPIALDQGAPFALGEALALGYAGVPRVPFSGQLSSAEEGDWLLRSVALFGATALAPNPITCQSCHNDNASDNITRSRQVPPFFNSGGTGPWGWKGSSSDLLNVIQGATNTHNAGSGVPPVGAANSIAAFIDAFAAPRSIYLAADGSLSATQQAGKALFEGVARCSSCHAAPDFIPQSPVPLTIANGIGTGLVPANVPSLRGVWATAPYLHNGSAATLHDVITRADLHGSLAASLTAQQRDWLVAYLRTL